MTGFTAEKLPPLRVTYEDDPRVRAEQAIDDYSRHVVPLTARTRKWSLTMAMWAVLSALFYLFISVAVAQAVGSANAIIGMVLSVVLYGVINYVIAVQSARNGLTVGLMSRRLFGGFGSIITSLLFGVTAVYFAVFEGSIIAVALKQYFAPASDIRWWYLLVVLYALPLVIGGVQVWLDKLNGVLLPLYIAGLVMLVVAAGTQYGYSADFIRIPASSSFALPGWLWAVVVYMGVFVNMMFTMDYARFGKPEDGKFHGTVTFGWVFYVALFLMNGLVGIYLMDTAFPGLKASEHGIADAVLKVAGGWGMLFIIISQTRINTANYYLASVNLSGFAARAFGLRWPRIVWVGIAGVLVYLMMLTNVFSYLLKALAWQGVAITSWVAIVLTHFAMHHSERNVPEFRPGRIRQVQPGTWAFLLSTAAGIGLIELGNPNSWYVQAAPIVIGIVSAAAYAVACKLGSSSVLRRATDPRNEVNDLWGARIECHVCKRSYSAMEMDRDPSADQQPICAGCAEGNHAFLAAAREEAQQLEGGHATGMLARQK
ncbi:purine-cytosine permease family protein [Paraburkholderia flagellata]|uniref:purine-cytosine permease family protein n=1 Tax=Paraburkholderia flagellata TaxID=2883241 RepID=UPI001F1D940A|nr:allantoin permease [Paraburkholderia flagellata]